MGKLQKLRLRFCHLMRSKLDRSATLQNRTDATEKSSLAAKTGDVADVRCAGATPLGACSELHWSEVRRICSEPTAELYRSDSLSSLVSQESDDVFLEGEHSQAELQSKSGGFGLEGGYTEAWKNWKIFASEISLGAVISCTKRETIYSGYWHGSVHVHIRLVQEVQDLGCFLEEVATLTCIRHENIQLFMGVCLNMTGGTLAVVMSELKGDYLHTRLHKYGHNFTNPSKTKILRQITEGMEYLHAKGIPHGSLSSKCVSLHHRVCISLTPQVQSMRSLEASELTYLPPENVRKLWVQGEKIILCQRPTFAADVFSFGTIVYELVTLEHPFSTLPLHSLIWQVGQGATQSLTKLPKGRFKSITAQCWRENPALRPTFDDIFTTIEQNVVLPSTFGCRRCHSLPCILTELKTTATTVP